MLKLASRWAHQFVLTCAVVPLLSLPVAAQGTVSSVESVAGICAPVIAAQYDGDTATWGQCIAAVAAYLDGIGSPSPAVDAQIADLVVALAELYRGGPECRVYPTELPEAIQLAASASTDDEQQARILLVRQTIADCEVTTTAAIDTPGTAGAGGIFSGGPSASFQ